MRNPKNTQSAISAVSVNFKRILSKSINPRISSSATTTTAIVNAWLSMNGILKTDGEKYSSSLNEKPTTSTAFTNPEAIKIRATAIRKICFILNDLGFKLLLLFRKFNEAENGIIQHIEVVCVNSFRNQSFARVVFYLFGSQYFLVD